MTTAFVTDLSSRAGGTPPSLVYVARFRLVDDDEKHYWDLRAEWAGGIYVEVFVRGGRAAFDVWNIGEAKFTYANFQEYVEAKVADPYTQGSLRDQLMVVPRA